MTSRVTITQSEAGNPFALHNYYLGMVAGFAQDPDSGYAVRSGSVTYAGHSAQHYTTYGAIVNFFGVLLWAPPLVTYLSSPDSPSLITEVRSGNFDYSAVDTPSVSPVVDITGLSLSLTQAMTNLETQVRYHPVDYFGSFDGDNFTGTDYEDMLNGGGGNDYLAGGLSNDIIYGGPGNDELRGATGADSIYGGQNNDLIFGGNGYDTLLGGTGDDRITGGPGADMIDGGDGSDTSDYTTSAAGVFIDLNKSALNNGGDATGDVLVGIEHIYGSGYADTLSGSIGNNTISGNFGDDFIYGRGGDDVLLGGPGTDHLVGGVGADTFQYAPFSGTDYVDDFSFSGGDVLNILLGTNADSFGEVMNYAHQYGNDTVFAFGGDYYLVVANAQVGQFTPSDFLFA